MTEKLYYQNSYIKTFSAHVTGCVPVGENFAVILDRTAFYPEGGGQPSDTGVLNLTNVLDVQERDGEIIHITDAPIQPESRVTGGLNWARRFRLMQQHTGEHMVSGIANRLFHADNVGFHMSEKFLTVDWNVRLDNSQVAVVERLANDSIYRNLPVTASFVTEQELKSTEYRSKKELQGPVRLVRIPSCDICACCGTHVTSTGEVGAVKILTVQNYKGGTRITLACGAQAMDDYSVKQNSVAALSNLLSAKSEDVVPAAEHLLRENAELKQELSELRMSVFELKASAIPEGQGTVCTFENGLSPDDLRRFALILSERCVTAAVFCCGESGYRYAISSAKKDVRPLGKRLNETFSGRGGGTAELVQGSLLGSEENIRSFFTASK